MYRDAWNLILCPKCVVETLMYTTDYKWYPNKDTMEHIQYGDESTYCVVEVQSGYRIFTRAAIKRRGNKLIEVVHSGTLKSCVEYIKLRS